MLGGSHGGYRGRQWQRYDIVFDTQKKGGNPRAASFADSPSLESWMGGIFKRLRCKAFSFGDCPRRFEGSASQKKQRTQTSGCL
jgi:hypothetical protein